MNWHTFISLDKKLQEISRYITLDSSNRKTWSGELASLLLLTGSAIDTFFRDMANCPCVQQTPTFKMVSERIAEKAKKWKKKKINWQINDFRDAYEPFHEFSKNSVMVPFGLGVK